MADMEKFTGILAKKREHLSDCQYAEIFPDETENLIQLIAETKQISDAEKRNKANRKVLATMLWQGQQQVMRGRIKQDAQKLPFLLEHYDIDTKSDHWELTLILKLARQFIAGFQYEIGSRGRRNVWSKVEHFDLLVEADTVKIKHPKWSLFRICEYLVSKDKYARLSARSLQNRYKIAKNDFPDFPTI